MDPYKMMAIGWFAAIIVLLIIEFCTQALVTICHDPEMLRSNPHYAPALKQRILSDRGHLSNDACAQALLRLIAGGTGTVILGHLSGENNTPALARRVSETALNREGIEPGRDVRLQIALRDQTGDVYCIRERISE